MEDLFFDGSPETPSIIKETAEPSFTPKLVLVVDDDRLFRGFLSKALEDRYQVFTASSGAEALAICAKKAPSLVLMDIEMPGMSGIEACLRLRQTSNIPVIFVTSHSSLEFHMEAFEAGATDVVCKPISVPILIHKVDLGIRNYDEATRLSETAQSMQSMAMNFLSTVGHSGVLLNFVRTSYQCRSFEDLGHSVAQAAKDLGLQAFGVIRHPDGQVRFRGEESASGLEDEIIGHLSGIGRIFQFRKQLVVNYDRVSIVVTNVPDDDPAKAGNIRDNLTILAETAEGLCDVVTMRQESMGRAEQMQVALIGAVGAVESLRDQHTGTLVDTRLLLQELIDNVQKTFRWLGTTLSQEQTIGETMNESVQRILDLLATRGKYDEQFDSVLAALRGNQGTSEVDLF